MGYGHNLTYDLKQNTAATVIIPTFIQYYTTALSAGSTSQAFFNKLNMFQALTSGSTDGAGAGDVGTLGMLAGANMAGTKSPKTGLKIVIAVKKPAASPNFSVSEKVSNASGATALNSTLINSTMLNAAQTTGCLISSDGQLLTVALSSTDTDTLGMLEVSVGVRDGSNRTAWVWDPIIFNVKATLPTMSPELNLELLRKNLVNNTKIDTALNTYTVYDDDTITPLYTYDLLDDAGDPSSTSVFERRLKP
jgi:hypothetical protein